MAGRGPERSSANNERKAGDMQALRLCMDIHNTPRDPSIDGYLYRPS
jgi:hypothetical protein